MKSVDVSLPEIAFVAATRGMAGAGAGLLLSEYFDSAAKRRKAGRTLLVVGLLTMVPIAMMLAARYPAHLGSRSGSGS